MIEKFTSISVIGKQDGPKNIKLSLAVARYCHLKMLEEQEIQKLLTDIPQKESTK